MNLILAHSGSYPRIGNKPEHTKLRSTVSAWETGQKSFTDLRAAQDDAVKMAITEQVEAGLDLVTDGQIRWYDPVSHVAGRLKGVKINGLLRLFDTNFYFRQPVVQDQLHREKPIVAEEMSFARSVSSKPVKPVLTGPYTLAVFSIVECDRYKSLERLVEDYAAVIADEIRDLAQAGAEVIQIDEPAVLRDDANFDLFAQGIQKLAEAKGQSKLAVSTYFGDALPLYARLQELPLDVIGVDFSYNDRLVDAIASQGSQKALGLGLIDARNTKLENEAAVASSLEKLLPAINSDFSYLNPSSGLEYLPRDRAFLKLKNLVRIGERFKQ
jgi:5-methyltetrahydropteroyltriglutamate--homocysteine methyltransferase